MACAASLVHPQQDGITIAVERYGFDLLGVAAGGTLDPIFLAGTRIVGAVPGGEGVGQRVVVHPGEHEYLTGVGRLGDGRHESLVVEAHAGGDGGVELVGFWVVWAYRLVH